MIGDGEYHRFVGPELEHQAVRPAVALLFHRAQRILLFVRVGREYPFIFAGNGHAYLHGLARDGRKVAHEHEGVVIVPGIAPYKAEYVAHVVGVVYPLEDVLPARVVVQHGVRGIYVQQPAVAVHNVPVPGIVAQVPLELALVVPFRLLAEVLAHEQQLFAGVAHHHCVRRL